MPINHPALYDTVYARMQNVLGNVLTRSTNGRNRVYRSGNATDAGRIGADKYRTVFKSSTNDSYRWTGPRPAGVTSVKPAAGGVYTSLGLNDALLGEFAFYAFGTTLDADVRRQLDGVPTVLTPSTFPATLATKRIFEYEFPVTLRIADLSLSGRGGRELLRAVESDAAVKAQLHAAGYGNARAAYLSSADHSLPRAIGQCVHDFLPGYRAIRISSARADSAVQMRDDEGDNIVFFGSDGTTLNDLRPVREISFIPAANGKFRDVIHTF
jgi:hypothetical protein